MPLESGKSEAAFSHNVKEMVEAGHPQAQAVAAAYREKRDDSAARKFSAIEDAFIGLARDCDAMTKRIDAMERGK